MTVNNTYIANVGKVFVNTANSSLNGTGALGLLLTANTAIGACGTVVSSIVVKATGSTALGMIRLFIWDGANYFLYKEVMVPANIQTGVVPAFTATIQEPFVLQSGYNLYVSTESPDDFNVIAYGKDGISCGC